MRQWLRLTKEATLGTFDASAAAENIVWPRLTADNAFSMIPQIEAYTINSFDARAEPVQFDSGRKMLSGQLTTPFYGSQAAFFLSAATTLVGTGSPATYSLSSFTADFYDGVRTRRYLGCQIANATLNCPTSGPATWQFQIVGQKVDGSNPTLAEPAGTVWPTQVPYKIQDTSTKLKLGTADVARAKYTNLTCVFANTLVGELTEESFPTYVYGGRKISVSGGFFYLSGETDRAAYEALTTYTTNELTFSRTDFHTVLLDWKGQGRITNYGNEWKMSGQSKFNLEMTSFFDHAAGSSFSYTVTAPA